MSKRLIIIACTLAITLGMVTIALAAARSSAPSEAPVAANPAWVSAPGAPPTTYPTHNPYSPQAVPAAGYTSRPASSDEPSLLEAARMADAKATSRAGRVSPSAFEASAAALESATYAGPASNTRPAGSSSLSFVQPGVTVDLVYERLYGKLQPGDTVTVLRQADSAYGAALADGTGFFWTSLFAGDGSGMPVDIAGGDVLEVYVNGSLETTLEPQEVSGGIDVLADEVFGDIAGDSGGTSVQITFGLWGVMADEVYPQELTATEVDGSFSETIEFDLGAENMAQVEYPIPGGWARSYLFPDPPVFLAQLNNVVAGYAPRDSAVNVTVYINYPDEVRWSETITASFPFGHWQINGPDVEPGDYVEVELESGFLPGATVAELHHITYDTDLEEVYGFAPTGETVRVNFWDVSDGSPQYVETHAVASADAFTAVFTDGDLRPSSGVGLFIADANGNETALNSGPPYIEAILDPRSERDCVMGRVDAPNVPITLTLQTNTGTYTRDQDITPNSDAGNLLGGFSLCFLIRGTDLDWGPINFAPGDLLTLESPTWQGQLTIADLAWQGDEANDQVTGSAPVGEVQVSLTQWHAEGYPVNGSAAVRTVSNGIFNATFNDFDLRRDGGYDDGVLHDVGILHYDPTSDFVNHLEDYTRYIQVEAPWGVWGFTPVMNEPVTAWLYDENKNLLASTNQDGAVDDPYYFWFGDFQGNQLLPGYWITITAESGWTAGMQIPTLTLMGDQATDMLWGEAPKSMLYLDGGRDDSGFGFFTPVDGFALDTAWLGHDLQFGDGANAYYSDLEGDRLHRSTQIGELFRVEFWLREDGTADMWGEAMPGLQVTITTPRGQFIAEDDPSCPGCWFSSVGELYPGEGVTVVAGDGLLPVVVTIPAPLTAEVDVTQDEVWGQIGGYTGTIQVHGGWENGYQEVQTDASGNYLASYDDIPRRAEGYVRFEDSVDVSYPVMLVYHRPFRDTLSLLIRANYAHEWVEGNYEAGHTLWITLTNATGEVKATASGVTGPIPWWGGDNNGFSTGYNVPWDQWQPDLQVGDWVYAALDNGQTTALHIGEITGELDAVENTVAGNVYAAWFTDPLQADCGVWVDGGPGMGFTVDPDGGGYLCDFDDLGYDLLPGHDVGVGYQEPDGDQVYNVFRAPAPELRVWAWGQGRPASGGNMVLWVSYQNNGTAPDDSAYLTAVLQPGLTYLDDTSGLLVSGSGTPADPLVWQLPSPLQPSLFETRFEVFVHVDAAEGEMVAADFEIDSDMDYYINNPGAMYAHWEDQVVAYTPDLSIGKSSWTGDPVPGSSFVYAVNVCNFNENAAGSLPVTLTDTLPLSTTLQDWWGQHLGWEEVSSSAHELVLTRLSVPGGWCGEVYLKVALDADAWPDMPLSNTATVAISGDPNPDTTTYQHNVGWPRQNLSIWKNWVSGQFVPGGEIYYEFRFGNDGNLPAESVIVTSTLPENTTFVRATTWTPYGDVEYTPDVITADYLVWDAGVMDNGFWQNVNLVLRINDDAPAGTLITHTMDINRLPLEDRYDDNRITWVDPLNAPGPNLWVNKQNYSWEWEGRLWYEIRIENRGTTPLDNVWLTDTYPEGTVLTDWWQNHGPWITATQDIPNRQIAFWVDWINPGETASLSFHLNLDGDLIGQQGLLFTNVVDAPLEGDVYPADNHDEVTAMTGPDVYIEKWVMQGEPKPGEQVTFRVRFGNANQSPWNGDVNYGSHITETLPAGMTFITSTWITGDPWVPELVDGNTIVWNPWWSMWSSSSYEFNLTVQIDEGVQGGDVLVNTIEAYGDSPTDIDPNPANNVFELPVTVLAPAFEVNKTFESSQVSGMPLRYDLSLANTGNLTATEITLVDTLPAEVTFGGTDGSFALGQVSWNITSLEAGATITGWITGSLTCEAGVEVVNQDYGVASSAQGVTADGAPVSFTTLAPDIQASFEASAVAVRPGQAVVFTAEATTDGTPLGYAWDFGDGDTASGAEVEHAFTAPGSYPVELTVTDECGFTASYTLTVLVNPSAVYLPLVPQGLSTGN